jgi:hypothetical protein
MDGPKIKTQIKKFNCLEQNVKGDKFKCEHHCGECVKSNHCQTQK